MIVPKDTKLVMPLGCSSYRLGCESQKVIAYVQVLFGASMSDISIGTDMTVYNVGESLNRAKLKLFAMCMHI